MSLTSFARRVTPTAAPSAAAPPVPTPPAAELRIQWRN